MPAASPSPGASNGRNCLSSPFCRIKTAERKGEFPFRALLLDAVEAIRRGAGVGGGGCPGCRGGAGETVIAIGAAAAAAPVAAVAVARSGCPAARNIGPDMGAGGHGDVAFIAGDAVRSPYR